MWVARQARLWDNAARSAVWTGWSTADGEVI